MDDPISQFRSAIASAGLIVPEIIETDGIRHRFSSSGKRSDTAGWYVYYADGIPAGAFGCWRAGISETWRVDTGKKPTLAEEAAHKKRMAAIQKQRKEEETARHSEAATKAKEQWKAAKPASENHLYLAKKGVKPYGTREHDGNLIIPLRIGQKIHSLQTIRPDGEKRFLTGGRISGCYYSIGKPGEENVMCIVEGFSTGASVHEATGHPVAVAFNAGNLEAVAKAMRESFPEMTLLLCADDDYRTEGNPGITKAAEAASAINSIIAIPDFGDDRPDGATDFNDLHQSHGLKAVHACIRKAIDQVAAYGADRITQDAAHASEPKNQSVVSEDLNLEKEINRLAAFSSVQYARERKAAAKRLGFGVAVLDGLIKSEREQKTEDAASPFAEVEPWDEPVKPDELLSEIAAAIRLFIVCEPETIYAATLWAAMTWFMDVIQVAPLAVITAPEKRCGKSQLLFILGRLVCKPLAASNISPSAMFRSIDKWQPTLLIDEADAFMRENEELRGLLNCGHTRESAFSIRTVGENHTPTRFNLWGAKALAGIGKHADTIMDRAITLELRRRLACEHVSKLRHADPALFPTLQRKLARFADDYAQAIERARPDSPDALHDRAQDNWEPLFAIADIAGGEWSQQARQTALTLSGESDSAQSRGAELLSDIQEVFEIKRISRIFTADLVEALCEDSEKSWVTYNRGKPIKPSQLSRRLAEYGITSKSIRIVDENKKGFELSQFADAFARYISSPSPPPHFKTSHVTNSPEANICAGLAVTEGNVTNQPETQNVTQKASTDAACDVVTDKNADFAGTGERKNKRKGFL